MLAPGPRDLALQYVDVRDLAEWLLGSVERELSGAFNLISAQGHATMGSLLDACVGVTGAAAELRWTSPEVVLSAGIEPWTQLPVWIPAGSEGYDALHSADVSRALGTGLTCRSVEETVADTWEWLRSVPEYAGRGAVGLDPAVEAKVLGVPLEG